MATTIKLKNSVTTTNAPSSLAQGEVAINVTDKKVWVGNAATTPVQLLGTGADGSFTNLAYTGTLTGGTGVVNLGSGQFYKDSSGNIGLGNTTPSSYGKLVVTGTVVSGALSSTAGSTLLSGLYGAGSLTNIGTMVSSGGPVVGYGVTGSSSTEYQFLSTTAANLPRSAMYMNGGSFIYYSGTAQTTAIGSTATMTETMRLDYNGNLGIGTSSPYQAKLDVKGVGGTGSVANIGATNSNDDQLLIGSINRGSSPAFFSLPTGSAFVGALGNGVANTLGVGTYGAAPLVFATTNTERMRIDSSGNLLVGTTTAVGKLNVVGGTGSQVMGYFAATDADQTGLAIKVDPTNSTATISSEWSTGGTSLAFGAGPSEAMRISNSLNISMGTTDTNNAKLTVDRGSSTATGLLVRGDVDGTNDGVVVTYSGAAVANFRVKAYIQGYNGVIDLRNGANNLETRINGGGGVPSFFGANAGNGEPIVFLGATTQTQVGSIDFFKSGNGSGSSGLITFNASGTSNYPIIFRRNGSDIGYITYSGTTVSYVSLSDYRLKEDIAPMTGALEKVAKLKPVTYKWKNDGSEGQGFIAHELAEICPDAVTGEKDAMRTEKYEISPSVEAEYDEDGNVVKEAVEAVMGEREVPAYQGVDTSFLVATLTKAIQEQQALIENLTNRLTALEGK